VPEVTVGVIVWGWRTEEKKKGKKTVLPFFENFITQVRYFTENHPSTLAPACKCRCTGYRPLRVRMIFGSLSQPE
jgi:hypothetical protein